MTEKQKTQLDKFKETARALECDEDEDAFKRSLRKVAKAKPLRDVGPDDKL
jgi:hypothetical protein